MPAAVDANFEHQVLLETCRKNVNVFISYCFLYDEIHVNGRPQKRFHSEWQNAANEHQYLNVFAPLEHGKTVQLSVWRTIWEIGNNHNLRIWILSSGGKLASKIMASIKQIMLTNVRVKEVFPTLRPELRPGRNQAWNNTEIIIERDLEGGDADKDATVMATGVLGSSIGTRVDILKCDDVNTYRNVFYEAQRDRINDWFKSSDCLGRLTADGRVVIIGNPWHELAFAHAAINELDFSSISYEACDDKFQNILWPTEWVNGRKVGFDEERLRSKLKKHGIVEFNRCYRCIAISDQTQWFNIKTMRKNVVKGLMVNDPLPNRFLPICGVDPAVKKSRNANFASFMVGGYNPITGQKRIRRIIQEKMSGLEILQKMIEIMRMEPDIEFFVEDNGQQSYLIELTENQEFLSILGADARQAYALRGRVHEFNTTDEKSDPEVGVAKMSADFEAQLWQIPECSEAETWFQQFLKWRPGNRKHTGDIVMASYFFWSEANSRSIGRGYMNETMADFIQGFKDTNPEMAGLFAEKF